MTFTGVPQALYGRAYALTLGPEHGGDGFRFGNLQGNQSALRIGFEVDKIAQGAANKGTVTLYNVNQAARTALVRGFRVVLEAGYLGLTERLLYGTVLKATSKREGPNIVTTLDVIDGLRAIMFAKLDKVWPPGTPLSQILQDIAEAMDVAPGVAVGIPNKVFARGHTCWGLCSEELTNLLEPYSIEWSVQNGKLNILPKGTDLGTAAIVINAQTGLLGIPSKNHMTTDFEALLNPKLVPGQLVQLQTKNVNTSGIFKIRSCKMIGDTHDQKWSVACQAVKIPQRAQVLSAAQGFQYGQAVVPGLL